jgi:hypothetical protein
MPIKPDASCRTWMVCFPASKLYSSKVGFTWYLTWWDCKPRRNVVKS